jgi:hypothetical protein
MEEKENYGVTEARRKRDEEIGEKGRGELPRRPFVASFLCSPRCRQFALGRIQAIWRRTASLRGCILPLLRQERSSCQFHIKDTQLSRPLIQAIHESLFLCLLTCLLLRCFSFRFRFFLINLFQSLKMGRAKRCKPTQRA